MLSRGINGLKTLLRWVCFVLTIFLSNGSQNLSVLKVQNNQIFASRMNIGRSDLIQNNSEVCITKNKTKQNVNVNVNKMQIKYEWNQNKNLTELAVWRFYSIFSEAILTELIRVEFLIDWFYFSFGV